MGDRKGREGVSVYRGNPRMVDGERRMRSKQRNAEDKIIFFLALYTFSTMNCANPS